MHRPITGWPGAARRRRSESGRWAASRPSGIRTISPPPGWRARVADARAASEAGVSVSAVAAWRRRVRELPEEARAAALLDRERTGRPSAIDANPAWRGELAALLLEFGAHLTAAQARKVLIAHCGSAPSRLRSLRRWIAAWRVEHAPELSAVTNPDRHRSHRLPAFGRRDAGVHRLNQVWELDSTLCDVVCLDGHRHALCAAVDVWSRRARFLVVPTSRATAIAALLRRCMLEWGVPETVRTDEGADYTSATSSASWTPSISPSIPARPTRPRRSPTSSG